MKILLSTRTPKQQRMVLALALPLVSAGFFILLLPAEWQFRCRFHEWSGLPCPTCGGTRCGQLILSGQFMEALQRQPLLFCSALVAGSLLTAWLISICFRWPMPYLQLEKKSEWRVAITGTGALILANWIYLILNLQSH